MTWLRKLDNLINAAALLALWSVTPVLAGTKAELATPETVLKAYMAVPRSQWQDRLPFVANAEKAGPLMKKMATENGNLTGVELLSVRGDTEPAMYPNIGDSRQVVASIMMSDGKAMDAVFYIVRTHEGFKVDWIQTAKPSLLQAGLLTQGELAENNALPEIAVKHLEAVGERYENKAIKMLNVSFDDIDNAHITSVPGVMVDSNGLITRYNKKAAEAWVGFRIKDRNGKLGFYFFAPKEKWADKLLDLERGRLMNLAGVVVPMEGSARYGVLVFELEVLDP